MAFDDEAVLESIEEGRSKTVEFGGFMKAEFGCKVTFLQNRKSLSLSVHVTKMQEEMLFCNFNQGYSFEPENILFFYKGSFEKNSINLCCHFSRQRFLVEASHFIILL